LVFLLWGSAITAVGQVNTEKFRRHSESQGFVFNTSFRFGLAQGNSEYISVDGTARLDYNGKKNNAFIVGNYDYKETDEGKVVNKGFVHLRVVHPFSKRLAIEGFLQQEFNELTMLRNRQLVGSSLRIKVIDYVDEQDSLTNLSTFVGLGLMYEHEVYDVLTDEGLITTLNPLRISTYLTFDWNITSRINWWAVGYYQPKASYFKDFRGIVETGMEIWVIGRLYFTVDFSYRYNNRPVGDVKHYDLVVKNGLRYSVP
jgi:hypothetical protein